MTAPGACAVVFALAAATSPAFAGDEKEFGPDWAKARLVVAGKALAPVEPPGPPPENGLKAGVLTVYRNGAVFTAKARDGSVAWTASVEGADSAWVYGVDSWFLYCRGAKRREEPSGYESWISIDPGTVRRLVIVNGKWAEPMDMGLGASGQERLHTMVLGKVGVAVLTVDPGRGNGKEAKYFVGYYPLGSARPAWRKGFQSAGTDGLPSAFRESENVKISSEIEALNFMGEDLLVCAGPREDLRALGVENNGAERWRIERLWEFERGFVGPSIWAHYIDRRKGAVEVEGVPGDRILAGPFIVPTTLGDGEWDRASGSGATDAGHRVFVVVGTDRGEKGLSGFLLEARVYEIKDEGTPIAVAPLPRPVLGWGCKAVADGVLLRHDAGAMSKVVPSRQARSTGMGDSGSDHVARIAWYRDPAAVSAPDCWITAGIAGRVEVLDADGCTYQPCGGYVSKPEEKVYRFPLVKVDFRTGTETAMLLEVPFASEMPAPSDAYKTMSSGGASFSRYWTHGPYLLAVRDITADGKRIRVTLATKQGPATVLAFEP